MRFILLASPAAAAEVLLKCIVLMSLLLILFCFDLSFELCEANESFTFLVKILSIEDWELRTSEWLIILLFCLGYSGDIVLSRSTGTMTLSFYKCCW